MPRRLLSAREVRAAGDVLSRRRRDVRTHLHAIEQRSGPTPRPAADAAPEEAGRRPYLRSTTTWSNQGGVGELHAPVVLRRREEGRRPARALDDFT